jgi:hypothetical protein
VWEIESKDRMREADCNRIIRLIYFQNREQKDMGKKTTNSSRVGKFWAEGTASAKLLRLESVGYIEGESRAAM